MDKAKLDTLFSTWIETLEDRGLFGAARFNAGITRIGFEGGIATMEKEIERLHDLLWVGVLCGACGHSYKYNRADDPDGEAGHEEHLRAYPDCPSR